ncbi:MFS transporter [Nocardioides sp.]|uniref:MFS transporter n=1 Tax=Nocardioides sp. TaxID=35761 RepID=UPI003528811E
MTRTGRRTAAAAPVLVAAVALIAINLRPGATSVGPVLEELRAELGMGSGTAGVLTSLPPLCFGLVGALAVGLARRAGATAAIALGALALTAGLLLRVTTSSVWLFLGLTVVALAGIAVGNVLTPAWVKHHGGRIEVALMTLYSTGLVVGGALGALLTAPLEGTFGGWRPALALWGAAALAAVPLWGWLALREKPLPEDREAPMVRPARQMAASPTAVAITALFGIQSMHAYVQFGWLPQVYRDAGLTATHAGALVALIAATGIVGSLTMPVAAARARSLAPFALVFGVLLAGGYAGLLGAPATLPWLWALMLGVAGFAFPLAIALLTARTRHPQVTAQLSGFVQSVGYLLAASGPVAVGLLHQATGSWTLVLWLLLASAVPFTWAGLRLSKPAYVDDELG